MQGLPQWFIDSLLNTALVVLWVLILWLSLKMLGAELHHFVKALTSEIGDLLGKKYTIGSLNLAGLLFVAVFGLIVIVAASGQKILGITAKSMLGDEKASELAKYSDYNLLFFYLGGLLIVSLICVVINGRRDR